MKRLVVCSDGSWNTRERGGRHGRPVTNVVKMARSVRPTAPDGTVQCVFYDEGVGTGLGPLDRLLGGGLGVGLGKNVGDAYRFLVDNYDPGDHIFLFGFSRGAYTARSTAGLLRKCGLLRKDEGHRFPEAFEFYRGPDHPDSDAARSFRKRHSREVPVRFLGVWDTVGALGIPRSPLRWLSARRYEFHDVALSRIVEHAAHAVAIDERRRAFEPTLWSTKPVPGQRVEQVWFPGAHGGVGGGQEHAGLSDVAFLWMKEQAEAAGLAFDEAYVAREFRPDPTAPLVDSRTGAWRMMPGRWRRIGDPGHQPQAVHPAALARMGEAGLSYAPRNLVEHLATLGSPLEGTADPVALPGRNEARRVPVESGRAR